MWYHAREIFLFKKFYLSSFTNNNRIHLRPDLLWIEESQHGFSTAGKMQIWRTSDRDQSSGYLNKQLHLCGHWPRVLDCALLPYDMVDADFNKEKGSQVVVICKYLKHSSGAELIKLLIMLKTQTEVRKKQEFVPQSRSDHRLIPPPGRIYILCAFSKQESKLLDFFTVMSATAEDWWMGSWLLPMGQTFIITLFIASMLMYLI